MNTTINPTNKPLLSVNSLGVRRSERWLFRDLSFQLSEGEIIQFVGKNGAGKTSLLRSLCGLLPQREGEIDWLDDGKHFSAPIFLGHLSAVKPELSVLENLLYHPISGRFPAETQIEDVIEEIGLANYIDTAANNLSAGQTRRVGLGRLLLAEARCWILDEPFTALDVEGCTWLELKISKFVKAGGAVLLTSHQAVTLEESPRIIEIKSPENSNAR